MLQPQLLNPVIPFQRRVLFYLLPFCIPVVLLPRWLPTDLGVIFSQALCPSNEAPLGHKIQIPGTNWEPGVGFAGGQDPSDQRKLSLGL